MGPPAKSRREPEAALTTGTGGRNSHGSPDTLIRNSKSAGDSLLGTGQMLGTSDCLAPGHGWPQPCLTNGALLARFRQVRTSSGTYRNLTRGQADHGRGEVESKLG